MSSKKVIALRLSGPIQSWGYNSEYTYRNSGLFPTKCAVLGICCAAMGLPRGSEQEKQFLGNLSGILMMAIALPRKRFSGEKSWMINVRRIEDFHTVENTKTASGTISKNAVMTYRQYLCDADFVVLLADIESPIADQLEDKLADPEWGMWLGRKSCIPSAPVFAGKYETVEKACEKLLGEKDLKCFTYQKEVLFFSDGVDTLMDVPLDFAIDRRVRGQRRVVIHEAENHS
ncbi:MAG: type I-E CRISPR-associated protein Cas5/CasD [Methylomonas sp.]|jgi:CRISPR system Cascade subunit CasD|uniref:type I-E CRISPR-associated protein Cas5/CasD n=1 Tax=Methylomonas sp. TaxID=418 RepID=UPI0025D9067C|nr:type I-E CRISPR-associated protein Cas5/CasD [Methylomonas sp.]MCK9609140.1 type I-E CRISPR-associated protein Cas5/CasD [Methylomonas sp.]